MTLYAGSQQSVTNPNQFYSGSFFPGSAPTTLAPIRAFTTSAPSVIGGFVWLDSNGMITPIKGSNTIIAGILARTQNSYIPFSDTLQGYSMTLAAGQTGSVVVDKSQAMVVAVTSLNGGGSINLGDGIYINNTTGVTEVSTSSPGSGHTATGYIVVDNTIITPSTETLAAISATTQV